MKLIKDHGKKALFSLLLGAAVFLPGTAKADVYVGIGTPVPVVAPPLLLAAVLTDRDPVYRPVRYVAPKRHRCKRYRYDRPRYRRFAGRYRY